MIEDEKELANPEDRAVITRLPMADWRKLKQAAKQDGRSIAGQVRQLLQAYINELER